MPIVKTREYRTAQDFTANEESFIVEGYASTFEPYVLATIDGLDYSEVIERSAFDNTDMSDVILQYDHAGKVYARTSNDTLQISVDEHGLKIRADLSKTDAAKELYNEIKSGMITRMSFAFTVNADEYIQDTRTRRITEIAKLYDVSAVSIPANPGTEINARSYFDGVIEKEKAERLLREARSKKLAKLIFEIEVF